ncbi:MAG TPA: S9 family peptidase, partial [Allosphingosinicella sp.]
MNGAEPAEIAAAAPRASIVYPATERQDVVEPQFGIPVADPYRWLENDVREDPKVAAWVAQQNALTDSYLATLPGRAAFQARLRELFNYERFGVPEKKANRYFYTRNTGLQNQNVLYVREGLNGAARML